MKYSILGPKEEFIIVEGKWEHETFLFLELFQYKPSHGSIASSFFKIWFPIDKLHALHDIEILLELRIDFLSFFEVLQLLQKLEIT